MPPTSDLPNTGIKDRPEAPPIPELVGYPLGNMHGGLSSLAYAHRGDEAICVYPDGGEWLLRGLQPDGALRDEEPISLGESGDSETTITAIGLKSGYLLAWDERVERNQMVYAMALDATGKPLTEPKLVTQSTDAIAWMGLMPSKGGSSAVLLWEVQGPSGIDVYGLGIADNAEMIGAPSVVTKNALSWDVTGGTTADLTVVTVEPTGATPKKATADNRPDASSRRGSVVARSLDLSGRPTPAIVLDKSDTAFADVAAATVGSRVLVAWSAPAGLDRTVMLAGIDPGGAIAFGARRVPPAIGEQALMNLVSADQPGQKTAFIAWEELLDQPPSGRTIQIGRIEADGSLGSARATLKMADEGHPIMVGDGDGLAALTLWPPADADLDRYGLPRGRLSALPMYVRLDASLNVRAADLVRSTAFSSQGDLRPPDLTHTLRCTAGACMALTLTGEAPSILTAVTLPVGEGLSVPPAARRPKLPLPHANVLASVADGPRVSELDAVETAGGGVLTAWVTYYLQPLGTQSNGNGATVTALSIDPKGNVGKEVELGKGALSVGGVAITRAHTEGRAVVAWIKGTDAEGELRLSEVDPAGAIKRERGVAKSKPKREAGSVFSGAAAADVAITTVDSGYVIGWVDTRDGNGEVYVASIDKTLAIRGKVRRITNADGDAADLALSRIGDRIVLSWSDSRDPNASGADVYFASLDMNTLDRRTEDIRLFASSGHSRSPKVTARGDRAVITWIEEPTLDPRGGQAQAAGAADPGLRIVELDARDAIVSAPSLLAIPSGWVSATALRCPPKTSERCRGTLTYVQNDRHRLALFEWPLMGKPFSPTRLASLTGGVGAVPSPALADAAAQHLFYADDTDEGTGRIRHAMIVWQ